MRIGEISGIIYYLSEHNLISNNFTILAAHTTDSSEFSFLLKYDYLAVHNALQVDISENFLVFMAYDPVSFAPIIFEIDLTDGTYPYFAYTDGDHI